MSEDRFFNLLKPIKEPKSSWDKIYDWIIGKARVVLLFVEILMVLIFFAKIIVDNTEKNRIQEFERLQLQLLSLESQYEQEFSTLQLKVQSYDEHWQLSTSFFPILNELSGYLGNPSDQFSLSINNTGVVQIDGYNDLNELKEIEALIKSSNTFLNVGFNTAADQSDLIEQRGRYSLSAFIEEELINRGTLFQPE